MNKILNLQQAINVSKMLRKQNKKIVVVGGCFDILHLGHIRFLKNAKKMGDVLLLLLESDESIKASKGDTRPVNTQSRRAEVLSAISAVDYVVLLPQLENKGYDDIIYSIHPNILATTKGDPNRIHKQRQASFIHAHVKDVIERIETHSTSALAKLLSKEL